MGNSTRKANEYKVSYNNNYVEFYQNAGNVLRRWKFNYRDNTWYEFYPDYSNSTLGRFVKTGRYSSKPLKPIKYSYYTDYGERIYY